MAPRTWSMWQVSAAGASSRVLSTPSAVVNETDDRGDRGAVVAADHQDGGQVVADVVGVGQGGAVGLGGMAAEARASTSRGWPGGRRAGRPPRCRTASCIGSIKADSSTRGSEQNRHNFWAKEAGFMPATVAPGPGAVLEPVFPNPLMSMA